MASRLTGRVAIAALALISLGSCGGGSDGGTGGSGTPLLISIAAVGLPAPLWEFPGTTLPICPAAIPLNAPLIFTFSGPVDSVSLPPPGPAVGALQITLPGPDATVPAFGSFSVTDEPGLPFGNRRRVVFTPVAPTTPNDLLVAGLRSPGTYQVFVPRGGSSPQVITIDGRPLANEASTCFSTCTAPVGQEIDCFADPVPGAPFVAETWPESGAEAPPAIDPGALVPGSALNPFATAPDTVTLFTSEPLFPSGVNLGNVRIVNVATGSQVPGQLVFFQAGTLEAGVDRSRIDYVASAPFVPNLLYEIQLTNQVRDFGGNAIEAIQGVTSSARRFRTQSVSFCPQPDLVETFDTPSLLASASTPTIVRWSDTGALEATLPDELIGTGAFGPLVFSLGNQTLDTGMPSIVTPEGVAFERGAWNTTSVDLPFGAQVRLLGLYPAHFRSTGAMNLAGTVNGNGATQAAPPGDPAQGPRIGNLNNGVGQAAPIVFGGQGGPGGGRGGNASLNGAERSLVAEGGFGPPLDGLADPGGTANGRFGGGGGGVSGFFPGGAPGETGGRGGAGGSAWASGQTSQPETPLCVPATGSPLPLAQPAGATAAFAGPVSALLGGSGGGGGGDHLDPAGPMGDDQGGGGGGGGGALRFSCVGDLDVASGAVIAANGIAGGGGSIFAGAGGAGSGGMIWLQSFSQVLVSSSAFLAVSPGGSTAPCAAGGSGDGGFGLIQLEDADGEINTSFIGSDAAAGANVFTPPLSLAAIVAGDATSAFIDTGFGDPRFVSATTDTDAAVLLGTAPDASVQIRYQGAFESVTSPETPDLATVSVEVPGSDIAALDGYRFVRFRVAMTYAAPPLTTLADVLPSVAEVRISFEAACVGP